MVCHYTAATSAPREQMAWFESTHRYDAPVCGATEQHLLHLVQLPLKSRNPLLRDTSPIMVRRPDRRMDIRRCRTTMGRGWLTHFHWHKVSRDSLMTCQGLYRICTTTNVRLSVGRTPISFSEWAIKRWLKENHRTPNLLWLLTRCIRLGGSCCAEAEEPKFNRSERFKDLLRSHYWYSLTTSRWRWWWLQQQKPCV